MRMPCMRLLPFWFLLLALSPATVTSAEEAVTFTATTPTHRTALLELFTSEGCSSCPPADALLAELGRSLPADKLVPVAFHVDYWDELGWKDPFADHRYSERQRRYADLHRARVVYTPQFLLGGATLRPVSLLEERLTTLNAEPSPRQIHLSATLQPPRPVELRWHVEPALSSEHRLVVLLTENGLESAVDAGENRGRRLRHEHVVRALESHRDSRGSTTLPLPPGSHPDRLAVVVFVETATGRVEQALRLPLHRK